MRLPSVPASVSALIGTLHRLQEPSFDTICVCPVNDIAMYPRCIMASEDSDFPLVLLQGADGHECFHLLFNSSQYRTQRSNVLQRFLEQRGFVEQWRASHHAKSSADLDCAQ